MASSTRVALVGSGYIAGYHARALKDREDAVLALVAGPDTQQLHCFRQKHDVPEVTDDVASVTRRGDIDAVVLCTPNRFHAEYALEFLGRGKDVLIEKPLACSLEEGEAIAEAEKSSGQLVLVGHMWRFDVEVNTIRDVVRSGRLGRIVKTTGYGVHENWGPAGWFTDRELAGGGALVDMGVHAIDTARYILGDIRPKRVFARVETCFGDYDVDDAATLMIVWENGVTSVVESGWWFPHIEGPEAATRILGTQGHASLFPTRVKLLAQRGGKAEMITPEMPHRLEHCDPVMYRRQMDHFLACIRSRETPVPGTREGLEVLRIVDAAYRSMESGQAVCCLP